MIQNTALFILCDDLNTL